MTGDLIRRRWIPDVPLEFLGSIDRFSRWGADPVNHVADGSYYRVIRRGRTLIPYRARQLPGGAVEVRALDPFGATEAIGDVRVRLAEALPAETLFALGESDPVLGPLVQRLSGRRPPIEPDAFESLVTSITAQQVNLAWARTTRTRLVTTFGRRRRFDGQALWAFPGPRRIATAEPGDLRSLQLTWRKSEYIIGLARAALDGRLDGLDSLGDDEVIARLTDLRGIGRWTADWFLARHLARPAAVAAGDLGVRKAVGKIYLGRTEPATEREVRHIAEGWGDAANWATHILLEALAEPKP